MQIELAYSSRFGGQPLSPHTDRRTSRSEMQPEAGVEFIAELQQQGQSVFHDRQGLPLVGQGQSVFHDRQGLPLVGQGQSVCHDRQGLPLVGQGQSVFHDHTT